MTFTDDEAVILFVKNNNKTPQWVDNAREYSKNLCALVTGENFTELLIGKIEHIESTAKALSRAKYARDIKDFYERLFLPIQNVFSANGGVKNYENGDYKMAASDLKRMYSILSNVRDGRSVERYIEEQWMSLYHTDPSGVLWMRYVTNEDGIVTQCYPTYHAIGAIRNYNPKGQLVENIIFEPYTIEGSKYYIVLDDAKQYTVVENGERFGISEDPLKTFAHPFGVVPVIINSNIISKTGARLSPIDKIIPISQEYARDQSVKTIYKFLHGFPKSWVMDMQCATCNGSKKIANDADGGGTKGCPDCNATGWRTGKMDVADVARIPFPKTNEDPVVKGDDIMGYSAPDLETLKQMTAELEWLECEAYETMWGVENTTEVQKTATEIYQDQQPKITKLNKYANQCEWLEATITELIANAVDPSKPKDESISLIVYGRRYILEGIDTIQKKYEDAKVAGENTIVLDGIFDELLVVKFKNDPEYMRQELKKAFCEPNLHYSAQEVLTLRGQRAAAEKMYFQEWWKALEDNDLKAEAKILKDKFKKDFTVYLVENPLEVVQPINTNQ